MSPPPVASTAAPSLTDLVTAWVNVSPSDLSLPHAWQQATQALPAAAWVEPVIVPKRPRQHWTLAAAVAWVHALIGPLHQPADSQHPDRLTPFAWWDKLATVSPTDPVWTARVFAENGGRVTVQGLRSLAMVEATFHEDLVTRVGQAYHRTPVAPGALTDADHAAALSTLRAAVGHWGEARHKSMRSTDWVTTWLVPNAAMLNTPTPAQAWGQTIAASERLTAVLSLQKMWKAE